MTKIEINSAATIVHETQKHHQRITSLHSVLQEGREEIVNTIVKGRDFIRFYYVSYGGAPYKLMLALNDVTEKASVDETLQHQSSVSRIAIERFKKY